MLRRLTPAAAATAAAALLLTGLTACSGQQGAADDCVSPFSAGVLSDGVVTLGEPGAVPQVSVPEDVSILTSQRTVVSNEDADAGEGRRVENGTIVGVNIAAFDTSDGSMVYASQGYEGGSPEVLVVAEDQPNSLSDALLCTVPGDRVVAALNPEDAALFAQQLGTAPGDPLVLVLDVVTVGSLEAEGRVRGLPSGFPAVVTDASGRPGVVLPPRSAPAGTTSAARIVGDGPEITAEDGIVAQVLEVGWDGGEGTNTWNTGVTGLGNEEQVPQSGYTFRPELTGHTVGSQVVIIENADDAPRVLVVDILAVV